MINIQNIYGNEYFKWCVVRYLNPRGHHLAGIKKADKNLANELDFKNINIQSKLETFTKLKERILSELVFLGLKIGKNIQSMYQKKNTLTYFDRRRGKSTMFLSMISIDSRLIIHYIAE